jgi:putative Mn2+ efflux pump MntP
MPLLGYGLGRFIKDYIQAFDHWIAFGVLHGHVTHYRYIGDFFDIGTAFNFKAEQVA